MSVLIHILHGKQWRDFTHRVATRRHQTALEAPRSGHLAWIVTKSDTSLSLIKIKDSAWRRSEYSGESFSILWWDQWNERYNAISRVKTTSILTALFCEMIVNFSAQELQMAIVHSVCKQHLTCRPRRGYMYLYRFSMFSIFNLC